MALIKSSAHADTPLACNLLSQDTATLVQTLTDDDWSIRRQAAFALAQHPEATEILAERWQREPEPQVRHAIVTSLVQMATAEVADIFLQALGSDEPEWRNQAIIALQQLPQWVEPQLDRLLSDQDTDVRIMTVTLLASLPIPSVEHWLIRVLEHDQHVNVCAAAIDILGEVGSEQSMAALQAVSRRFEHEPFIAFAAELALKRIRGD